MAIIPILCIRISSVPPEGTSPFELLTSSLRKLGLPVVTHSFLLRTELLNKEYLESISYVKSCENDLDW